LTPPCSPDFSFPYFESLHSRTQFCFPFITNIFEHALVHESRCPCPRRLYHSPCSVCPRRMLQLGAGARVRMYSDAAGVVINIHVRSRGPRPPRDSVPQSNSVTGLMAPEYECISDAAGDVIDIHARSREHTYPPEPAQSESRTGPDRPSNSPGYE
jgi:hypothetical protein